MTNFNICVNNTVCTQHNVARNPRAWRNERARTNVDEQPNAVVRVDDNGGGQASGVGKRGDMGAGKSGANGDDVVRIRGEGGQNFRAAKVLNSQASAQIGIGGAVVDKTEQIPLCGQAALLGVVIDIGDNRDYFPPQSATADNHQRLGSGVVNPAFLFVSRNHFGIIVSHYSTILLADNLFFSTFSGATSALPRYHQ